MTPANTTISSSQGASQISLSYDAATRSYTVVGSAERASFGPSNLRPPSDGQIDYRSEQGDATQFFTLTDPSSALNGGIRYVGGGYWQRNRSSGNTLEIRFDAFTYGFETAGARVPRVGQAGFDVDLFAFFAPPDRTPKVVRGDGVFTVDFRDGLFATQGTATEIDLTDPYYTGTHNWRGSGQLSASGNAFSGLFSYEGRDRFNVAGAIDGQFYGPDAEEVGAAFRGQDANGVLLAGTLLGVRNNNIPVPSLTVLPTNRNTEFFTAQRAVQYTDRGDGLDGGASMSLDAFGDISFAANGDVKLVPKRFSSETPSPTFTAADRVAAESDSRFTTYRKTISADGFALTLFVPGAANSELQLTYTSFGRWDRNFANNAGKEIANLWFIYGVPTAAGTLPRNGNATYSATLFGSGVTFADSRRYSVSGTASMRLDLASLNFEGKLSPIARQVDGAATITFAPMAFAGAMGSNYGFESFLSSRPGFAEGDIRGQLYGPQGAEFGAAFGFLSNANGAFTGSFAGAAVGKRD